MVVGIACGHSEGRLEKDSVWTNFKRRFQVLNWDFTARAFGEICPQTVGVGRYRCGLRVSVERLWVECESGRKI